MKYLLSILLIAVISLTAIAQNTLRGTIKNGNGEPIPGASIMIDGSAKGTITDLDGNFSIELQSGYETLIISAEGFGKKTIYLTGETSLNISLDSTSGSANEINDGFGGVSKDELTTSVSSVDASDVSPAPLINLEQANQGVTAGLFVQNSSGTLGQPTQVRIRGGSSLSASNQPLYVVDGVPLTSGNQSNINPSNIASIEILKDASATAIYGTRAANGVIIITTKDGTSGGLQVNFDYQYGVSDAAERLDMQSGDEHRLQTFESILRGFNGFANALLFNPTIEINGSVSNDLTREFLEQHYNSFVNEVIFSDNSPNPDITFSMPGFYEDIRDLNANTDWQDEVFRTAVSHRANIDFQGGSKELGYFASVGYNTQEGILIGNKFDRLNGSLSLNSKLSEKLSANLNLNYIYTDDSRLNENQDLGFPLQALALPPSDNYDPDDAFRLFIREDYNPLTEVNFASNLVTNNSLLGSLGLKYEVNDDLTFDVNGGIDNSEREGNWVQGPETQGGAGSTNGRARISNETFTNYVFNGWLTYSKDLDENDLSIIFGGSYQKSEATFTFSDSFFPDIEPIPGSASSFLSGYTRVTYSLGDQFNFQLSGRMDGSSKFSEANRFGFFPAISAGWSVHNAPFYKSELANQLKIRASYGLVGNTPVDDFLYRRNYFRSTRYGVEETIELANLANENLKWETTAQLNFGLDFGLLNDRISGSVDYYIKTTTDLLFPVPVTQTSGFSTIFDNIGEMENKGFEVNLSTVNAQTDDFSWTTDFNISSNQNIIKDLKGEQAIVGVNAFLEGQSAGVFYMRKFVGVDSETGRSLYDDGNGGTTTNWEEAPRMIVGDPNPELFGGITNSIAYKNFEFSFMFQFVSGIDLYFQTGEIISNNGILNLGQTADQSERWYAPGDVASIPVNNPFSDFPLSSSRWLSDGSYVRLKNITPDL